MYAIRTARIEASGLLYSRTHDHPLRGPVWMARCECQPNHSVAPSMPGIYGLHAIVAGAIEELPFTKPCLNLVADETIPIFLSKSASPFCSADVLILVGAFGKIIHWNDYVISSERQLPLVVLNPYGVELDKEYECDMVSTVDDFKSHAQQYVPSVVWRKMPWFERVFRLTTKYLD